MNLFSPWQLEVLQEQLQPCRANLLVHGPCLHHCNHRNKVISHLWKPKSVPLASSGSDGVPTSNDIQFLEPTSWDELIHEGRRMKDVIKIGRRGVCLDVVEHIKKRWHTSKIAKIYCSGKPASNMKRLAEELERSTGGVIISRSGGSILLLRPEEITSVWRMSNEED